MSKINETARLFAHTLLEHEKQNGKITEETIQSIIDKLSVMDIVPGEKINKEDLFEILISDLSIGKGAISLLSDNIEPWLNEEKTNIHFELWNRYKLYLQKKDPSFPVNELDDFTDKILDKCVNPKQKGSWDRRGMVVGHVQSGKTSNYVGLINKATDAGYKVIIVIAGTISSLRRQTQERIDEGYIGRNSSAFIRDGKRKITGVGQYNVNTDIYSLTSSYYRKGDEGDFNQAIANRLNIPIGNNPVVFVIKKNKSILENLIDWFSKDSNINLVNGQPKLMNVPALIIDDEADAASVNATKDINEVKTINKLIRTLLNIFDQNTFIGYTATPYANLFIPQDFNEELSTTVKGKQYLIGADLFFEKINKSNKDNLPEYLPKSLEEAIMSFILTCAIRRIRGHSKKHNSMLVHVALYVIWIDRIALLVDEKVKEFRNKIEANDEDFLNALKKLYIEDYIPTTENILDNLDYTDKRIEIHDWEDVKSEIKNAVTKIDVRAVHGTRSTSKLEYHRIEEIDYNRHENGLYVIAVGGSRLARGITLEGLSISYYLRTTKMYDSLMQMGRWFGYRPGYVDLCRLFTNERIFNWFNHITMATEEMRNDFDELTITHQKPSDFRLKVRNHSGLLTITSVAKLHWAQNITVSFSGTNPQTYQLTKTESVIKNNFNAFENLFKSLGYPKKENIIKNKPTDEMPRYLLYKNCDINLLCDFLDLYKTETPKIKNANLSAYIKKQNEIKEWNIALVSNTDKKVFIDYKGKSKKDERKPNRDANTYQLSFGEKSIKLGCSVRNHQTDRDGEFYLISKNQIDDMKDRQVDLNKKGFKKNNEIKKQRAIEKKGLLLIYALDERGTPNVNFGVPIIGYSLHFPSIENEQKISYTATIFDDFDDDIMSDDDNQENE